MNIIFVFIIFLDCGVIEDIISGFVDVFVNVFVRYF